MQLPETAFKNTPEGCTLRCRVQPGASRSSVVGADGEDVKAKLAALWPQPWSEEHDRLCSLLGF